MQYYYRRFFMTLFAVTLLTGCASTTPNISLDKTKTGPIASAALLRINESQQFKILNLSGLPALGGAIGGLIAGDVATQRSNKFVEAYNKGSVHLADALAGDLQHEFSSTNIEIAYTPSEFAKIKNGADDYSHIQTDKDAILSVWFGPVGYIADGVIDAPYQPWVVVHVRLLDGKTKKILSQKSYTAGYQAKTKGTQFVSCATSYRFSTFDTLMDNFDKAVEGLSECEKAIAQRAAEDLK